ncbi:MAG: MBL fold metallo-hydrolase [Polyangiaceae bacterium]
MASVRSFVASRFALDGGAMHGIVPRAAWERVHPADAQHRIALAARVLVIEDVRHGFRALVDAGLGAAWSAKDRERYALTSAPPLREALTIAGLDPSSITHVLATHLHWDHAGGLVDEASELTLPDAEVLVSARALAHARRATLRDAGSFRDDVVRAVSSHARLTVIDDAATSPLPGVELRVSDGHTPGLLIPIVLDERTGRRIAAPTDLLPTRSHVKAAWVTGYDLAPARAAEEKQDLVRELAREGGGVSLYHDAEFELAWFSEDADGAIHTTLG